MPENITAELEGEVGDMHLTVTLEGKDAIALLMALIDTNQFARIGGPHLKKKFGDIAIKEVLKMKSENNPMMQLMLIKIKKRVLDATILLENIQLEKTKEKAKHK